MIPEIQAQLLKAFRPETDRALYRAATQGVLLADECLSAVPFMNTPIAHDLRGHIRRAGVMFSLKEACDRGDLPFHAEYEPMPIGAWHWLEIKSDDVLAHVCRTEDAHTFPENGRNRQDARLKNQLSLFDSNVVIMQSRIYAWLMMAADKNGTLTHLCWGAPGAIIDEWLGYRNILASIQSAPMEAPAPSPISPTDKLRFRDHVNVHIEKSKKDKDDSTA